VGKGASRFSHVKVQSKRAQDSVAEGTRRAARPRTSADRVV